MKSSKHSRNHFIQPSKICTIDVVFRQIEIVLKDSTAFVHVTKSEKSKSVYINDLIFHSSLNKQRLWNLLKRFQFDEKV